MSDDFVAVDDEAWMEKIRLERENPWFAEDGGESETLHEYLHKRIARADEDMKHFPRKFYGDKWFQFTWAEAEVFWVNPVMWPRQVLTYDLYETLRYSTPSEHWPQHLIDRARPTEPGTMPMTREAFQQFAAQWSGLGNREATYVFKLMQVRDLGDQYYEDEHPGGD